VAGLDLTARAFFPHVYRFFEVDASPPFLLPSWAVRPLLSTNKALWKQTPPAFAIGGK